jgi:hypothetical protein
VHVTMTPARSRSLEFGIFRGGDNNLNESQTDVLAQARDVSLARRSTQCYLYCTLAAIVSEAIAEPSPCQH